MHYLSMAFVDNLIQVDTILGALGNQGKYSLRFSCEVRKCERTVSLMPDVIRLITSKVCLKFSGQSFQTFLHQNDILPDIS
jgi:hypothetical protein